MNQANQDIIDSEFSDETFLNELNKYPIVRNRDWQGWKERRNSNEDVSSSRSQYKLPTPPSIDPNEDFWTVLYKFLKVYYGEETTNNILKEFKKLHSDYVHSLSYDDIERLANILP